MPKILLIVPISALVILFATRDVSAKNVLSKYRSSPLPTPVIHAKYPTLLVWRWDHRDPYKWNAYLSLDNGITYQYDDFVYGSGRQYAPDGGSELMYIVGVDKYGKEVTGHSNAIKADDI